MPCPHPLLPLIPLLCSPPLLIHAQSLLSGPGVRPPSYTQLTHTGPGCPSDVPDGTVARFSGSSGRAGDLNFRLAAFTVEGQANTWCDIALQFGGNQETRTGRRVAVNGVRTRFHLRAAGEGRVVATSAFDSWWEDGEEAEHGPDAAQSRVERAQSYEAPFDADAVTDMPLRTTDPLAWSRCIGPGGDAGLLHVNLTVTLSDPEAGAGPITYGPLHESGGGQGAVTERLDFWWREC